MRTIEQLDLAQNVIDTFEDLLASSTIDAPKIKEKLHADTLALFYSLSGEMRSLYFTNPSQLPGFERNVIDIDNSAERIKNTDTIDVLVDVMPTLKRDIAYLKTSHEMFTRILCGRVA